MRYLAAIDPTAAARVANILSRELGLSWNGIFVLCIIVLIFVIIWNSNQNQN